MARFGNKLNDRRDFPSHTKSVNDSFLVNSQESKDDNKTENKLHLKTSSMGVITENSNEVNYYLLCVHLTV